MFLLLAIAAPILLLVGSTISSFLRNLRAAKSTGLPIVISPVSHINPLWLLCQSHLTPVLQKLPFGLGSFTRYNRLSWFFDDKYKMHQQYGKVFMHVTPGMNELHVADPSVNAQIFAKKRDFEKPRWILESAKLYGDSISSVTGADWQRHRRITAPPFNESNSRLVWNEAIRQAGQMMEVWSEKGSEGFNTVRPDTMTLGLNVLATAAFGKTWHFRSAKDKAAEGYSMNYRDCLAILLQSIGFIILTPRWCYSYPVPFLPAKLNRYLAAREQFGRYMEEMVAQKKVEVAAGEKGEANFLNTLVIKSGEAQRQAQAASKGGLSSLSGLKDNEIYGNLFTYNLAGHETTANAICYATYLLATFPTWQDWIGEEVDEVYRSSNGEDLPYETTFPQLKRCLATMFETLRLYCPVLSINKSTVSLTGNELEIDGKSVVIPYNTMVAPNVLASHTLPEYWGKDHMEWRPSRWIESASSPADDRMLPPPSGRDTFIPWSDGARVCPGKKFSQVEFVAVISTILRRHRLELVPGADETVEQARERALGVIQDSETQVTLQMRRPLTVNFKLVERMGGMKG